MSGLSRREWWLAREVVDLLKAQTGMTTAALAARLRVTEAELKAPVGMLIGRGLAERCGDYLTLPVANGDQS